MVLRSGNTASNEKHIGNNKEANWTEELKIKLTPGFILPFSLQKVASHSD